MGLKRRTFLQKAGLGLAALGISETVLSLLGDKTLAVPLLDRYFQVLAQPSGRKLALLVGINQYPRNPVLAGCVTDVQLQRELLIHRFGFKADDILTLTDKQATRESIETAFIEHLTKQARSGDVVVFHFSGYGSRVTGTDGTQNDIPILAQDSLVPVDGTLQTKQASAANDLLEETLILLLRSLQTDHITTILDTSHISAGGVLQGGIRVRSFPNPPAVAPSPEELAFQQQVLLRLNGTRDKLSAARSLQKIPGLVLKAAGPTQLAAEAQWNGFSAGLFTYGLTQYLWQAAPVTTVQISLSRAASTVNQVMGQQQQPRLVAQNAPNPLLAYYLPPDPSISAEGVVTAIEDSGKTLKLWLAGLPATVLDYYGSSILSLSPPGSFLPETAAPTDGETQQTEATQSFPKATYPQVQIRSKEGLTAKARLLNESAAERFQLQVGQLVRESVRLLPRNLGLTIALDSSLERIERVDATSAFSSIAYVSSVTVAGEQPSDYLFGKVLVLQSDGTANEDGATEAVVSKPKSNGSMKPEGYGLFYLARNLIRNTSGEAGEAVKSAVNRLTPTLKTLLASKLLRLTANQGSSLLGVRASLEKIEAEPILVMQQDTWRVSRLNGQCPPNCRRTLDAGLDKGTTQRVKAEKTSDPNRITPFGKGSIPIVPIGSRIQYRLENYSDQPIYVMLLGIDSSGSAITLYNVQTSEEVEESDNNPPLKQAVIQPGGALNIPESATAFEWSIQGPVGLAEIQLICCRSPFKNALKALEAARRPKGRGERIGDLFNPLEVAQAVLKDLHEASATTPAVSSTTTSDSYALNVEAWATLNFIYQIV